MQRAAGAVAAFTLRSQEGGAGEVLAAELPCPTLPSGALVADVFVPAAWPGPDATLSLEGLRVKDATNPNPYDPAAPAGEELQGAATLAQRCSEALGELRAGGAVAFAGSLVQLLSAVAAAAQAVGDANGRRAAALPASL